MRCLYCDKRLGIIDLMRGREYCSPEHRQLHLDASLTAYNRLSASFAYPAPKKPIVRPSKALPEAGPSPEISAAQLKAKPEVEQVPEVVEAQPAVIGGQDATTAFEISNLAEAVSEVQEAAPAVESAVGKEAALEIASLAEALESTRESVLGEARFLPELASPHAPPESQVEGYAAELISATIPMQASTVQSAVLKSPPPGLEFPFTESAPITKSGGGQATWLEVPENYPPVVITPLGTLVLDPRGADLMPAPITLPHSAAPDPILPAGISEPQLQQPVLPEAQPQRAEPEPSALFAGLPLIAARDSAWSARQGSGYASQPLLDPLPPEQHLSLIAPPFARRSYRTLPGSAAFITEINAPVPAAEGRAAPLPNLPVALIPRSPQIDAGVPGGTARHLPSAGLLRPVTTGDPRQIRDELPLAESLAVGPRSAVGSEPPRIPGAPVSMRTELKGAAVPVTLEYSSISGSVQAVEMSATFVSAPPEPLLPHPSSIPALRLPWCSGIERIVLRAPDLASISGETRPAPSAAYLHPSLPSPLSLVTWSQSISVMIQTCEPSYLNRTAPVAWSAPPMRVPGLRPSGPGRGQRLTPLLPVPGSVAETAVAPTPGSQWPLVVYPIRPSADGTAAPDVIANRLLAASMPALPGALSAADGGSQTGPATSGPMREDTYGFLSRDMAPVACTALGEWWSDFGAVLPAWRGRRYAPAMTLAPRSPEVTCGSCPPVETRATIQPFGAVPRLAWSLIAYPAPMDLTLNS